MANQAQEILDSLLKQRDVLGYRTFEGTPMTIDWLLEYAQLDYRVYDADCPYINFAHTKNWCGFPKCSEG